MTDIAVFVSGNGTNCESLIKHFRNSDRARVALVVSSRPDAYALVRAAGYGVPTAVLDKASLNDPSVVLPLLQRIGQIGRAAKVHLVACTQCPTAQILSTQLRCNFDSILGLRTRSPQDSRNIIGMKGCEKLPDHGQGYYITPQHEGIVDLPLIPEDDLRKVADHWSNRNAYIAC